ncbi:cytochrome c maturation protein CcmE [Aliidiomarina quisquiliarum]|uniref:cytochrome c maturation protein CcmE n=1 Tax=Aliidiomarina quisquiliarum TaxID=2938947 RepID=UPI00208FC069|nr:cytochrome c maturation protein CcmE [Aliidiomarina quisquiliarum]MCO4321693.1 cytochrome c maturation protein CcmE [Aliidiomarina quisquiliarum]
MNPRRKKRLAVIGSIVGAVAIATALVLYALSQNIDLFYTPSEIVEGKGSEQTLPEIGQRLRVGGLVVPGTVERLGDSLHVAFRLVGSGEAEVIVEYEGVLPDLFREGQGIVAQGVLVAPNRIVATEVLARHDEEYMPPALAKELKGIEHVPPSQSGYGQSDYKNNKGGN